MSLRTTANALHNVLCEAVRDGGPVTWIVQSDDGPLGPVPADIADRVVRAPVADGAAVALAVGLAAGGRRPVLELADTGRLGAVVEALADAVRLGAAELAAPVVVRVPYGSEAVGVDQPIGPWLDALHGVRVVCPSTPASAVALLREALQAPGPTLILEPRRLYRERGEGGGGTVGATILSPGRHVTLAAVGSGVAAAVAAADALAADGIEAEVIDLVCLQPLDVELIGGSVRRTGRLVVAHDGDETLARRVRELALDEAFLYLEAPLASAPCEAGALADAARSAVEY